jgi:predicted SAM-dependent methyltransferase
VDGSIRLDLAAGHFRQPGWIAVDLGDGYASSLTNSVQPDVVADIRDLPFPDDYADEARAIHVIEHFYAWEALDVVKEWVRVIKPGAQLAIECPSMDKVLKLAEVPQVDPRYTYWALYGDPRHKRPEMSHKWCYTQLSLVRLMTQAGLVDLRPEPPQFHFPIRDIRVVGNKPKTGPAIVLPGRE